MWQTKRSFSCAIAADKPVTQNANSANWMVLFPTCGTFLDQLDCLGRQGAGPLLEKALRRINPLQSVQKLEVLAAANVDECGVSSESLQNLSEKVCILQDFHDSTPDYSSSILKRCSSMPHSICWWKVLWGICAFDDDNWVFVVISIVSTASFIEL